jgi:hypothetical protein
VCGRVITTTDGHQIDDITISGCDILGFDLGVRNRGGRQWIIRDNYLSVGGAGANEGGVVLNAGAEDVLVADNVIVSSGNGVVLANGSPSTDAVVDVDIVSNLIDTPASSPGVWMWTVGAGAVLSGVRLGFNVFFNSDMPLFIEAASVSAGGPVQRDLATWDQRPGYLGVVEGLVMAGNE